MKNISQNDFGPVSAVFLYREGMRARPEGDSYTVEKGEESNLYKIPRELRKKFAEDHLKIDGYKGTESQNNKFIQLLKKDDNREEFNAFLKNPEMQLERSESTKSTRKAESVLSTSVAGSGIDKKDTAEDLFTHSESAGDFIKKYPKAYRIKFAKDQGLSWYDASLTANRKLKSNLRKSASLRAEFVAGLNNFRNDRVEAVPQTLQKSRKTVSQDIREMSGKGLSEENVDGKVKAAVRAMDRVSDNFNKLAQWDKLLQQKRSPLLKGGLLGVITATFNQIRNDSGFKKKMRDAFGEGKYEKIMDEWQGRAEKNARNLDRQLNGRFKDQQQNGENKPWYKVLVQGQGNHELDADAYFNSTLSLARINLLESLTGVLTGGGAVAAIPAFTNVRLGVKGAVLDPGHDIALRHIADREYMSMVDDLRVIRDADEATSKRMVRLGSRAFRNKKSYETRERISSTVSDKEFNRLIGQLNQLLDAAKKMDKAVSASYKQSAKTANKGMYRWFEINDWGRRAGVSKNIAIASNTNAGRGERIAAIKYVVNSLRNELRKSRKVDMNGNILPGHSVKRQKQSPKNVLGSTWQEFQGNYKLSQRKSFVNSYMRSTFKGKYNGMHYIGADGKKYEQNEYVYNRLISDKKLFNAFCNRFGKAGGAQISAIARAEAALVKKVWSQSQVLENAVQVKTRVQVKLDVAKMRDDQALAVIGLFTQREDFNSLMNTYYAAPALRIKIKKYYDAFNKVGGKSGGRNAVKNAVKGLTQDGNAKAWLAMVFGMMNGSKQSERTYLKYVKQNMNAEMKAKGNGRKVEYSTRGAFGGRVKNLQEFKDVVPTAHVNGQYVVVNHLKQIEKQTKWLPQMDAYLEAVDNATFVNAKSVQGVNLGRSSSAKLSSQIGTVGTPEGYYVVQVPMRIESFGREKVVYLKFGIKPECTNLILLQDSVRVLEREGLDLDPVSASLENFYVSTYALQNIPKKNKPKDRVPDKEDTPFDPGPRPTPTPNPTPNPIKEAADVLFDLPPAGKKF